MTAGRVGVVAAIGTTQTIAWASSYYLPAILGAPIAKALGLRPSVFFAVFSAALLLSAAIGPSVGRLIDRLGGRIILTVANLVIGAGLAVLAGAHDLAALAIAWAILGLGMGMGLYDPAFAALTHLYGRNARTPITGITLIAGFASTIGWPATAALWHAFGWRPACLVWAAVNLAVAVPVNWLAIPRRPATPPAMAARVGDPGGTAPPPRVAMPILAFYFAATWFVTGAMAAQLPRLLVAAGATMPAAIAAAALVGPAQVGARLVEFGLLRRFHPIHSARLAAALHPLGAVLLMLLGVPAIMPFALLHGAGNGMITIAKGTLPLALFGPSGYGRRNGLLAAPARLTQSAAPFLFGLLVDRFGTGALALSAGLSLAAAASLLALSVRNAGAAAAPAG